MVWKISLPLPLLRIATGLHIESLLVQLSRCSLLNPENDTELIAFAIRKHSTASVDAVRLVNPRLPSLTRLATLSRCFAALQQLLTDEFASFPSLPLPIDQ